MEPEKGVPMSYPKKMQEKPFHYVVQKWHEGSHVSLLLVILPNFLKSKIGLSHINVCHVCEGEEFSSFPVVLCEERNNIFLWVQSLGSEGGLCQKRAWD